VVRSWGVPPFRIYYQRHPDELLIVRVYTRRADPSRDKPYCLADGVLRTSGTDEVS